MNKLKRWSNIGCLVLASVVLANCGSGNSSSTANLRVVNATITHQSLDLLIGASVVVPATVADKTMKNVRLNPTAIFEPMQCRVKRALRNLHHIARYLLPDVARWRIRGPGPVR